MKKRLLLFLIAFVISFTVMIALSFISIRRLDTLIQSDDKVGRSYAVLSQLDSLEGIIKDIDRSERGYMLTHDSEYTSQLTASVARLFPVTESLRLMTMDNQGQQNNVTWLKTYFIDRRDNLKSNLRFADTASAKSISTYFYEGRTSMRQCTSYIQKMRQAEYGVLMQRTQKRAFYQQLTSSGIRYLFWGFGFITILLFVLMVNEFRKRLGYQEELQSRLIDLRRSHNELEQIAFAASHDLQEPLRKMQVFITRLTMQNKGMDATSIATLERISYSASRMQDLIEDLADLTSLVSEQGEKEKIDLNEVLKNATAELALKIEEKHADIQSGPLPVIKGYTSQVQLVFKALLDNSIKFSREDIPPVIIIKADKVNSEELKEVHKGLTDQVFHRILISDNGIGFDNKFMHKMFQLFQRLHNQQSIYEGKGIGLAISQRVMANHKGYILAHGHPNAGATFKLYFPAEN